MADNPIHALLEKNLGLHVASIGESSVERAVGRRARALGLADRETYLAALNSVPGELKELIEEVVIPETWFFRDTKPFAAVVEYALGPWASQHRGQTLRLLSVPCSTGEEPYSLAMALLAAGWGRNKFQIEAIDISRRSLNRALEGRYTGNSFRGDSITFRDRYFTVENGKYVISPIVRHKVRFHHGNILDQSFMASMGIFDVVFCRNVLIYFDEAARKQAIATLSRMVASDGLLFTGHAEASFFLDSPFSPAPYRQSFAFVRKKSCPQDLPATAPPVSPPPQAPLAATSPCEEQEYLKRARTAADRGSLGEALELCQKQIHHCGPSASAFFLLGVIQDAAGDENDAFASLRRAVYLEPEHEEALLLLSLLAEKLGDSDTAKAYQQRVQRCRHDKETG
jgi:chemotaxis protein methyltransferase WspC